MRRIVYTTILLLSCVFLAVGCSGGKGRYEDRMAGVEALNSGDYAGALAAFNKALDKSRGIPGKFELDVLKYRAEAEYRAGEYGAAVKSYDALLKADAEIPEYAYMKSMARAKSGDLPAALEDYKSAVNLDKKAEIRTEALLTVGAALEESGQEADAMVLYQQALSDELKSGGLYNRMGLCRMTEKSYEEALNYFGLGLQAQDQNYMKELKFNQAVAYEYKGDFKMARELMESYVQQYGADETAERELAFLRTR